MFVAGLIGLVMVFALALGAAPVGAQPAPPPQQEGVPASVLADPPAEIAALRARWEGMTEAQIKAQGYVVAAPACVSSPFGGMGYHAMNFAKYQQQWASGVMEVNDPPILLLDENRRVVGLEWETDGAKPAPTFLGAKVLQQPGHPGVEAPHYMMHVYFKPNNKVLWAIFDPDLVCAQTAGPPTGMPATGGEPAPAGAPALLLAAALLLMSGLLLRRAIRPRA
jgi:hypothetical protein